MASPQKENGYTAIANEIMDALIRSPIRGEVRRVIDFVLRKTYGFNKKADFIALSQFNRATGMKQSCVCRALKEAVAKRLLVKAKNGYSFNKNYEQWVVAKRLHPVAKRLIGSSQLANLPVAKRLHTKDTLTKDTYTKERVSQATRPQLVELVKPYEEKYGKEMIQNFLNYWTQKNLNGKRELWEKQKAFEVGRRLATWAGRDWNQPKKVGTGVIVCHDGSRAIFRGGAWVDADNPFVKIDVSYYPELTK